MPHVTQKFSKKSEHKPSVRFDPDKNQKLPLTNGFYLNREAAQKLLSCDDLDGVNEIEVTVRIK